MYSNIRVFSHLNGINAILFDLPVVPCSLSLADWKGI
jgi:hypothetical protein